MKCLLCGKESNKIVCNSCVGLVDEDLCYRIIKFNYEISDNEIWKSLAEKLEKTYMFRDYAFEVAEFLADDRKDFVKIQCMNLRTSYLGVPKEFRDYMMSHYEEVLNNENVTENEKNLVRALVLEVYLAQKKWDDAYQYVDQIGFDSEFLEPYLIVAEYYLRIRDYDRAIEILDTAKESFNDERDLYRIEDKISDCTKRKEGAKKHWKPTTAAEIEEYKRFLDWIDVEYETPKHSGKKNKVLERDFKDFNYYEEVDAPDRYVALWITTEYYPKQREIVEISAVRVENGGIKDEYHSFVKTINTPKNYNHVNPDELKGARTIKEVFPEFLSYLGDDIVAIADVDKQNTHISRLARYSMMDCFENKIFDVVMYGEDVLDDDKIYDRESLLKKYNVQEGNNGMEKAKATMTLLEKIRKDE